LLLALAILMLAACSSSPLDRRLVLTPGGAQEIGGVPLKQSPDSTNDIGSLPFGSTVVPTQTQPGWIRVQSVASPGLVGWVKREQTAPAPDSIDSTHMEALVLLVAFVLGVLVAFAVRALPPQHGELVTSGGLSALMTPRFDGRRTEPTGIKRILSSGGISLVAKQPTEMSGPTNTEGGVRA